MPAYGLTRNLTCAPDVKTSPPVFKSFISPNNIHGKSIVTIEPFPVSFEGRNYEGHIAYRSDINRKRPVVLVFPNYSGEKHFDVDVATFLAKLGYVGLSVDLYGSTETYPKSLRVPETGTSQEVLGRHFAGAFQTMNGLLKNPKKWRALQSLYLELARKHKAVHPSYAAAIGYCFGGQCVLEMLRNGDELQGIVSFHGLLHSKCYKEPIMLPNVVHEEIHVSNAAANKYSKNVKVLIENGVRDKFTTSADYERFKSEMIKENIDFSFHDHGPDVDHGFALSPTLLSNSYNERADRRSTNSMIDLFSEIWPEFPPEIDTVLYNACGTELLRKSRL